jgi:hypothetical protein
MESVKSVKSVKNITTDFEISYIFKLKYYNISQIFEKYALNKKYFN